MSELTLCNYCKLREIKARAKAEGKKVVVKRETNVVSLFGGDEHGWIGAYVAGEKVASFMELTKTCCC